MPQAPEIRHLVVVLGDQLDRRSSAFDGFDAAGDRVWMCEASEESTHVWCSKQRITIFLSAMRHFAAALRSEGVPLLYREMAPGSLAGALAETLATHRVQRVVLTEPGDWRVAQSLRAAVGDTPLELREDRHFLCSRSEFDAHGQLWALSNSRSPAAGRGQSCRRLPSARRIARIRSRPPSAT